MSALKDDVHVCKASSCWSIGTTGDPNEGQGSATINCTKGLSKMFKAFSVFLRTTIVLAKKVYGWKGSNC